MVAAARTSVPRRILFALAAALPLAACAAGEKTADSPAVSSFMAPSENQSELYRLISQYARAYEVPESLVHRVVQRESSYNPGARNGPYFGLMQILPQTAKTMGHGGAPQDLLDAETNLKYGVKYLRGAWLVADGDQDRAVGWYARGYYYEAKRKGLLKETGLRN